MNNRFDENPSRENVIQPATTVREGIAGYSQRVFSSFRNPVYRLYFYSLIGHWGPMNMQMFVRNLLIYRITGSGALLGTLTLAHALPMLFLSLYGGTMADRLEKRKVLIYSQIGSAAVTMAVGLTLSFGYLSEDIPNSWWVLLISGILQGVIMGLMMPSRATMVPEIVEPEDLMNAISLNNMGMNVFRIIAPAATGFIVDAWDFAAVYYLMTGLYMMSTVFLLFIPRSRPAVSQSGGTIKEMVLGFQYLRSETLIMVILLFTMGCTILGMPFNLLLPMFTEDILMVGASGLGILMAVSGIGAVVVSFTLASMKSSTGHLRWA